MPKKRSGKEIPVDNLRWRLDPATLPFKSTEDLKPLKEIIGQNQDICFSFPKRWNMDLHREEPEE